MRAIHKNLNISGTIRSIYRNQHSGKLQCAIVFDGEALKTHVDMDQLNIDIDEEFYLHEKPLKIS